MKKYSFLKRCMALACGLGLASAVMAQETLSPYISKVFEILPAPGQQTNKMPLYTTGDTPDSMVAKVKVLGTETGTMVSLGGYGGYVVFGFDHKVKNNANAYDLKINGNGFTNSAEPGIVMVSVDANGNGLPDDEWYELAGSEYYRKATIKDYEISYFKPNPLNADVDWTDNQGKSGKVFRNTFNKQESYYPLWYPHDTLKFTGTLLPPNAKKNGSIFALPEYPWGYADNVSNAQAYFDIAWAVNSKGERIHLEGIDFVKVYTGVNQSAGSLGETSTEFVGAMEVNVPLSENLKFSGNASSYASVLTTPNSIWDNSAITGESDDYELGWFKYLTVDNVMYRQYVADPDEYGYPYWDGFTCSNHSDTATSGYGNEFSAKTGRGVDSAGTSYILAYVSDFMGPDYLPIIKFSGDSAHYLTGAYIANTTVAYNSMRDGDAYAKKFGGASGTDKDWFKLKIKGYLKGVVTDSIEFYLADFRSDTLSKHYILKDWTWVDMTKLGKVDNIQFSMFSSDMAGNFMNTPSYFCMDKLTVADVLTFNDVAYGEMKAPEVTLHPVSNTQCQINNEINLKIEAAGTGLLAYQWFKNQTPIQGATSPQYHISTFGASHIGSYYCVVYNTFGSDTSLTANLAIEQEIPTYTLHYNVNGGTAINDSVVFENTLVVLPVPVKAGYTFAGWFTHSDFSGDSVTQITVTQDTTVHAKWSQTNAVKEISDKLVVNLYPNPAADYISIEAMAGTQVEIFNTLGKNVLTRKLTNDSETMAIGSLPKGMYIVRLSDSKGRVFQTKLIKQ